MDDRFPSITCCLGQVVLSRQLRKSASVPAFMTRCVAAQALFDLEATNAELKSDLRDLYITKAEEIDGKSGRKAIIVHVRPWLTQSIAPKRPGKPPHRPRQALRLASGAGPSREALSGPRRVPRAQVPYRLLKNFHRVQPRLVRELEKKFSGKDVTLVANRRIMPKQGGGQSNARPRSRTLTAVRPPPGGPAALAAGLPDRQLWERLRARCTVSWRACRSAALKLRRMEGVFLAPSNL